MFPSLPVILASLQYMHPAHREQVLQRCTEGELRNLLAEASRTLDKNLLQTILLRILFRHEHTLQVSTAQHNVQVAPPHHNAHAPPPQQYHIHQVQHMQHLQHVQSGLPRDQPALPYVHPQTTQASAVGYHGPHLGRGTNAAPSQSIEGSRGPVERQVMGLAEAQVGAGPPLALELQPPPPKPNSPRHTMIPDENQIREQSFLPLEHVSNNERRPQTPVMDASGTLRKSRAPTAAPTTPTLEISTDKSRIPDSPTSVSSEGSTIHVVAKPKEQPTSRNVNSLHTQPRFEARKRALATDSQQENTEPSKRVRQESSDLSSLPPEFDRGSAAYESEGVQQVCESTENNDKFSEEPPRTKVIQQDEMFDISDDSGRRGESPDLIDVDACSAEHDDSDNNAIDSDTRSVHSDYSVLGHQITPPSQPTSRSMPRSLPKPIDDPDSIDWVLYTPSMNKFSPLYILPARVRTELMFRFVGTYRVDDFKDRKRFYERFVRKENQDTCASSKKCLNLALFKGGKEMIFQSGNVKRACDHCIKMRRLCARVIKDGADGIYKLGFFPLPEGLREGVMWDNIAFWVQSGGFGKNAKKSHSNRKFVRKR